MNWWRRLVKWYRIGKICRKCGLVRPDKYPRTGKAIRSGKTTRMMIEALLVMWKGEEAVIIGHSIKYSKDLADQIDSMARKVSIKKGKCIPMNNLKPNTMLFGRGPMTILRDHFDPIIETAQRGKRAVSNERYHEYKIRKL